MVIVRCVPLKVFILLLHLCARAYALTLFLRVRLRLETALQFPLLLRLLRLALVPLLSSDPYYSIAWSVQVPSPRS